MSASHTPPLEEDRSRIARARLAAALEKAKATCQELQSQGIESAKAALNRADQTTRAHSYEAIGIALGAGILLGALLRRK